MTECSTFKDFSEQQSPSQFAQLYRCDVVFRGMTFLIGIGVARR